jgi:trimethylamine---corrinoid protein Co-methyltransferase
MTTHNQSFENPSDPRSKSTAPPDPARRPNRRGLRAGSAAPERATVFGPGLLGGTYTPLTAAEVEQIVAIAFRLLSEVGMGEPIPDLIEAGIRAGCHMSAEGRLCFPEHVIRRVIADAAKSITLYGRGNHPALRVFGSRVHLGTTGLAPKMLDFSTGKVRSTALLDHFDFGRLVDRMENIHYFSRALVATDVPDLLDYDINVTYACFASTTKHFCSGFTEAAHVKPCMEMLDTVAGGAGAFRAKPFMTVNSCPVVSPLRFGADNALVAVECAREGIPLCLICASQAGATAPASLAGALAQNLAETLSALAMVNLIVPGHPILFGSWPFITDLRTGSFSGGSGEQALLMAASCQVSRALGLPTSVSAGMTDAKGPDNQAGFEKALTTVLAATAGANTINASAGVYASLLVGALEGVVIDNDMYGCIERVLEGISFASADDIVEEIRQTVHGPGHYLGNSQTFALMKSEFLYPRICNRMSPDEWVEKGAEDVRAAARRKVVEILSSHYPQYVPDDTDRWIRKRFRIHLEREAMAPSARW